MNDWKTRLLDDVAAGLRAVAEESELALAAEIRVAATVFVFGQGREGYMLRAFAMRLAHLGVPAHYLWHPGLPPAQRGDLLLTSSGTGDLATVSTLVDLARHHGCRVVFMTADPAAGIGERCDLVIHLPAKTAGSGEDGQPLGSSFEQVQLLWLDGVVARLAEERGLDDRAMAARHTNWE